VLQGTFDFFDIENKIVTQLPVKIARVYFTYDLAESSVVFDTNANTLTNLLNPYGDWVSVQFVPNYHGGTSVSYLPLYAEISSPTTWIQMAPTDVFQLYDMFHSGNDRAIFSTKSNKQIVLKPNSGGGTASMLAYIKGSEPNKLGWNEFAIVNWSSLNIEYPRITIR
jgi:hypothetical protein